MSPTPVARPVAEARRDGLSYRILSTFPPTACGLATFTAALSDALVSSGGRVGVVRVADGASPSSPMVVAELENNVAASVAGAIDDLSAGDVAIIQHEYGLYGGVDGDEVLEIMRGLTVPSIVVLHTVLLEPTPHQREVLEAVVDAAAAVIVMTESARQRLRDIFDVDDSKVATIAHGAAIPAYDSERIRLGQAHGVDVGPAGRRQGHRMGHRRDGATQGRPPPPSLSDRRENASQSRRARRRALPRHAHPDGHGRPASPRPCPSMTATEMCPR